MNEVVRNKNLLHDIHERFAPITKFIGNPILTLKLQSNFKWKQYFFDLGSWLRTLN